MHTINPLTWSLRGMEVRAVTLVAYLGHCLQVGRTVHVKNLKE